MDLVTFLITTFNSEKFILECLRSIANQTYKKIQILIIDDGSSDNTINIIKAFPDNRIELYCKDHQGISKSLNFALDKVKGEFVARIGSDDVCSPDRIEKQLNFFNDNPEYGLIGSNFILISETGDEILKIRNPEKDVWIKDQMFRRCCIWDGSILIRKELLLNSGGFDENLIAAEDWDLYLRLIDKTKFFNMQQFLSFKRSHSNNISLTKKAKEDSEKVLLFHNNSLINDLDLRKRKNGYFNIGYFYYYQDRFDEADKYLSAAIQIPGFNFQVLRYYFLSKHLKKFIKFSRKRKLYKLFDWLRILDTKNKFLRNKF